MTIITILVSIFHPAWSFLPLHQHHSVAFDKTLPTSVLVGNSFAGRQSCFPHSTACTTTTTTKTAARTGTGTQLQASLQRLVDGITNAPPGKRQTIFVGGKGGVGKVRTRILRGGQSMMNGGTAVARRLLFAFDSFFSISMRMVAYLADEGDTFSMIPWHPIHYFILTISF